MRRWSRASAISSRAGATTGHGPHRSPEVHQRRDVGLRHFCLEVVVADVGDVGCRGRFSSPGSVASEGIASPEKRGRRRLRGDPGLDRGGHHGTRNRDRRGGERRGQQLVPRHRRWRSSRPRAAGRAPNSSGSACRSSAPAEVGVAPGRCPAAPRRRGRTHRPGRRPGCRPRTVSRRRRSRSRPPARSWSRGTSPG